MPTDRHTATGTCEIGRPPHSGCRHRLQDIFATGRFCWHCPAFAVITARLMGRGRTRECRFPIAYRGYNDPKDHAAFPRGSQQKATAHIARSGIRNLDDHAAVTLRRALVRQDGWFLAERLQGRRWPRGLGAPVMKQARSLRQSSFDRQQHRLQLGSLLFMLSGSGDMPPHSFRSRP